MSHQTLFRIIIPLVFLNMAGCNNNPNSPEKHPNSPQPLTLKITPDSAKGLAWDTVVFRVVLPDSFRSKFHVVTWNVDTMILQKFNVDSVAIVFSDLKSHTITCSLNDSDGTQIGIGSTTYFTSHFDFSRYKSFSFFTLTFIGSFGEVGYNPDSSKTEKDTISFREGPLTWIVNDTSAIARYSNGITDKGYLRILSSGLDTALAYRSRSDSWHGNQGAYGDIMVDSICVNSIESLNSGFFSLLGPIVASHIQVSSHVDQIYQNALINVFKYKGTNWQSTNPSPSITVILSK